MSAGCGAWLNSGPDLAEINLARKNGSASAHPDFFFPLWPRSARLVMPARRAAVVYPPSPLKLISKFVDVWGIPIHLLVMRAKPARRRRLLHAAMAILCAGAASFQTPNPVPPLPYTPLQWKDVAFPFAGMKIPAAKKGESFGAEDGVLYASGRVLWITHTEDGDQRLLVWEVKDDDVDRVRWPDGRVHGMAYDTDAGEIYVRGSSKIIIYDAASMDKKREVIFPAPQDPDWHDMVILDEGNLAVLEGAELGIYSVKSGVRKRAVKLPIENVQRILPSSQGRLLLWSPGQGQKLFSFTLETGEMATMHAEIPARDLYKAAMMDVGRIGIFNPEGARLDVLMQARNRWLPLSEGLQRLDNADSVRYRPVHHRISAVLTINAKEDLPASEVVAIIPPVETYSHRVDAEAVTEGSGFTDTWGNRHIRIQVPALKKGKVYKKAFYFGELTRYAVALGTSKAGRTVDFKPKPDTLAFLRDHETYRIRDSMVSALRDRLIEGKSTVADMLNAVYRYAVDLKYVRDSRIDVAPTVIEQGHGGAAEHAYVQIALLRGAGVPARLAWVWLPKQGHIEINHKIAEAWIPEIGWIPMEPLAPPRSEAGTTFGYHIIFAVMDKARMEFIQGGDRFASFGARDAKLERMADLSVQWKLEALSAQRETPMEPGIGYHRGVLPVVTGPFGERGIE